MTDQPERAMPARARIVSVNVSPGGVPKRNVGRARVGTLGLEGDGHDSPSHGGPTAAVCLYTAEAIARVRADGHDAFAGAFGENLTVEGLETGALRAGDRLAVGEVVLELTRFTSPCKTIARFFRGGDFARILADRHPDDSRWYARVLAEGEVAVGDEVRLLPTASVETGPAAGP